MNIAIDLDDTLVGLLEQLILFHNDTFGTKLKRDDFNTYFYEEVWGGSREDAIAKVMAFAASPYFQNMRPLIGAVEGVKRLKNLGHNPFLVTGRDNSMKDLTRKLLNQYFSGYFCGIYHTNAYSGGDGWLKKSEVCALLQAPLIIDDDPIHIHDCTDQGIKVLVYDNPWNRIELPIGATRVLNWDEIITYVNQLAAENL